MDTHNPFEGAMVQLGRAVQTLKLDRDVHRQLQQPEKFHSVAIPVEMDHGGIDVFTGYRSQYSSACGPYKGGIRFSDSVHEDEVRALSFWMAIKCAAVGLPLGGGKGGIIVDPRKLSQAELERLSRGYVRALFRDLGPDNDIPAPDVGTNPQVLGWMVDEYAQIAGTKTPGAFTGKNIADGGIAARDAATGRGGFFILEHIRAQLGKKPEEMKVAVQGFGNVGSWFVDLAYAAGYTIVGMSDSKGALLSTTGVSIDPALVRAKKEHGEIYKKHCTEAGICDVANYREADGGDVLTVDCDVLVPAAIENQITADNAADIKAHTIIELANGPTTPEADDIVKENNVTVVPDVLANAGGVTVSYFEWLENTTDQKWGEEKANDELKKIMTTSYDNISAQADTHDVTLRTAAFIEAIEKISDAMEK